MRYSNLKCPLRFGIGLLNSALLIQTAQIGKREIGRTAAMVSDNDSAPPEKSVDRYLRPIVAILLLWLNHGISLANKGCVSGCKAIEENPNELDRTRDSGEP
jgi:hypothetical protein